MKERPILFSAPMVRALLDGSKTQTRRIVKSNTGPPPTLVYRHPANPDEWWCEPGGWIRCPYGSPGDRLWVRESLLISKQHTAPGEFGAVYAADGSIAHDRWSWKRSALPSIHMPRGLSRITLEIESVRVERLHDISEEDARAEGAHWSDGAVNEHGMSTCLIVDARDEFQHLWRAINGADSWDANPWVWVIGFRRVTP